MKFKSAIFLGIMLVVTGCNHYINWLNCTFNGNSSSQVQCATVFPFICSKRLYQEFRTVGIFDILWLSKEVIAAHDALYAERRGMPNAGCCFTAPTEQQLAQPYVTIEADPSMPGIAPDRVVTQAADGSGDTLSFYVLMSRADFGMLATLDTVYPPWTVTLSINGKFYEPTYLKAVDLDPEYVCMLNICLLKFRRPFMVKFDTALGELTASTDSFELIVSGVCFKTSCIWRRGVGAVCS